VAVLFKGEPVTVIEKLPSGVLDAVLMVRALAQGTVQGLLVKEAVVPAGSPEAATLTTAGVPEISTRVIVLEPEAPRVTLILPFVKR